MRDEHIRAEQWACEYCKPCEPHTTHWWEDPPSSVITLRWDPLQGQPAVMRSDHPGDRIASITRIAKKWTRLHEPVYVACKSNKVKLIWTQIKPYGINVYDSICGYLCTYVCVCVCLWVHVQWHLELCLEFQQKHCANGSFFQDNNSGWSDGEETLGSLIWEKAAAGHGEGWLGWEICRSSQ